MTAQAAARRPRSHAPPEARRAQILAAALVCFGERGFHATTMDDLVQASGLSKGSLYWHFHSKEDVFLALCDAFTDDIFRAWEEVDCDDRPALEILMGQARTTCAWLSSQRPLLVAWSEFVSHPAGRERFARVYVTSRERLAAVLRRGVARGEIRDLPVESVAAALTAAIEGMFLQALVDPGFDPGAHLDTLWEVLRGGMEA
jgi:TetR/AcrR family transcriptional repressor of uid operon